ncbi:hypothetical protein IE53DRAFT_15622 [Violaceomyces palustris]|uniref:Uncharacterized protein n=1 Tax=Violaceomyces palustris TaxID=1673888 RepID=A0ACD0P256_9BASI|nr:hypothetical protein IE53DRAFT_15622 [Violaceomyces palustris]
MMRLEAHLISKFCKSTFSVLVALPLVYTCTSRLLTQLHRLLQVEAFGAHQARLELPGASTRRMRPQHHIVAEPVSLERRWLDGGSVAKKRRGSRPCTRRRRSLVFPFHMAKRPPAETGFLSRARGSWTLNAFARWCCQGGGQQQCPKARQAPVTVCSGSCCSAARLVIVTSRGAWACPPHTTCSLWTLTGGSKIWC